MRPVTISGVTLYLQRTGKALVQFVFVNEFQSHQSTSASVLSPHLIKNPIELRVSRGTSTTDANYIYILNSDGTLTVFNSLISEDVSGFTRWETKGKIKSVAVVDTLVYLLVERTVNAATVFYVERENALLNTDSAKRATGLASATLTGLDHLEGETVVVKADGAAQEDAVVTGGSITIGRIADTIEAGLKYTPEIRTMPLNVDLPDGPNAAIKKRIVRVAIQLFESNGLIVNGERIFDKTIGVNQFSAPIPQTGLERKFLRGYSVEAEVVITQDTPFPLTILSIAVEVSSG